MSPKPEKVTVACAGRFHLFDQAQQLQKRGLLRCLVADYPYSKVLPWSIPREKVVARAIRGLYGRLVARGGASMGYTAKSLLTKSLHRGFATSLSNAVPEDSSVLICHSSYTLEAIEPAKARGMRVLVDHGSLSERNARRVLVEESDQFGFARFGNWQYDWLIEREEHEFAAADGVMVCSDLAKVTLVADGCAASKIMVNRLGVDLSSFYPGRKNDDTFRVVYCGGINPLKGVHYLVRAFQEMNLPDAELWLVGGMSQDARFQTWLRENGSENTIYKGVFPQGELRNIYAQATVFVLPSLTDGWGMVVLQAMACGIPVIVSDMAGACEAVREGENGFVIPSRSVESIKEILLELYGNPEKCRQMGQNALASVTTGYTWDEYGERLVEYINGTYAACSN